MPTVAFRVPEEVWAELERRAAAIPSPLGSRGVSVHDIARELMLRAMQDDGGSDPAKRP